MTVQWEGQKTETGALHPDHCRILFYLTLSSLKETIIDVQIQNRIVAVTIFNQYERPEGLLNAFVPLLKEKLSLQEYQLSSVVWKGMKHAKERGPYNKQSTPLHVSAEGVDVRV